LAGKTKHPGRTGTATNGQVVQLVRRWRSTNGLVAKFVRVWSRPPTDKLYNLLYNKLATCLLVVVHLPTCCTTCPSVDCHLRTSCQLVVQQVVQLTRVMEFGSKTARNVEQTLAGASGVPTAATLGVVECTDGRDKVSTHLIRLSIGLVSATAAAAAITCQYGSARLFGVLLMCSCIEGFKNPQTPQNFGSYGNFKPK
jgi:hypothetical protein